MKVLMADDHWVFRAGLKHLMKRLGDLVTVLEAGNLQEAITLTKENPDLDLILLDLLMPGSEPFSGLRALHDAAPKVPIVVLSVVENRSDVIHAIELGAMGYVTKSATGEEILKAVNHVLSGDVFIPRSLLDKNPQPCDPGRMGGRRPGDVKDQIDSLTQRQREVFQLLAQGKSNPEIARELGVSAHTVRIHISAILRVLGVTNRTQAAVVAVNHYNDQQRSEVAQLRA